MSQAQCETLWHGLPRFILLPTLWDRCDHYPCFGDEEAGLHSQRTQLLGFERGRNESRTAYPVNIATSHLHSISRSTRHFWTQHLTRILKNPSIAALWGRQGRRNDPNLQMEKWRLRLRDLLKVRELGHGRTEPQAQIFSIECSSSQRP